MDQSVPINQEGQAPQQAFQPGSAPSKEKGIFGAPKGRFGRQKRENRLSQSEGLSSGAEDERFGTSLEGRSPYGQSPVLHGLKNSYHRNGHLSSSPRSPNTRGHFQARRTRGNQQDEGHSVPTVKASGIPHRQSSRGRNRTSSETEQGSRGPYRRRRGYSEAENGSVWENLSVWESRVSYAAFFLFFFLVFALASTPAPQVFVCLVVWPFRVDLLHYTGSLQMILRSQSCASSFSRSLFILLSLYGSRKEVSPEFGSRATSQSSISERLTFHLLGLVVYFVRDYFLSWLYRVMLEWVATV